MTRADVMTEEKPAFAACCLTDSALSLAVKEPIWTPHLLFAAAGAGLWEAGFDGEAGGAFFTGWAAGGAATGELFGPVGAGIAGTG